MSDPVIIALVSGFLTFLGLVINGVVAVLLARLNQKQAAAAVAVVQVKEKAEETAVIVKEVKTNLEQANTAVDKKLTDIHLLVNNQYGIALKLNALNSRWRAESSGKPEDVEAAQQAERLNEEHINQQANADLNKPKETI